MDTGDVDPKFYLYWVIRRIPRYLAALLFLGSLSLPAFTIGDPGVNGIGALIYGWVGFRHPFGWPWLANPNCLLTGFLFYHRQRRFRRAAVCTAAAAFLLSLSFLLVGKIQGDQMEPMVGLVTREVGYWIWLGGMAALLSAAILNNRDVLH